MPVLQGFLCFAFFGLRNIVHLIFIALSILSGVLLFSIIISINISTDTMETVMIIIAPMGISKVYSINPIKDNAEAIKSDSL